MCLTVVLNYCCYRFYCKRKYEECKSFSLRSFQVSLFKEMFSFMGWMVYGAGCIIGRTQGTAILLNRFYDTAINAAFGIAQQVSGQFSFLSVSLITAIRPPIVKAEGSGNRDKMFRLTEIACKFSFLLLSIVAIPSIIHMDTLLILWLENVPTYSVLFCRFILMSALIDQLTIGLGYANSAIGNVRGYTIIVNTIKLFTLPLIYILLKVNCSLFIVMTAYFFIEATCMSSRLFIMNIISNISIRRFCVNVFVPVMIPFFVTCITCYIVSEYLNGWYIILNYIVSLVSMLLLILLFGLRKDEKKYVLGIICRLI